MIQLPEFTKEATFGDLLDPAMKIAIAHDYEAAKSFVEQYRRYLIEHWDRTPEDAENVINTNLGYWAGYYDNETRVAVQEVFGALHPIFGATTPTAEEALEAGKNMMRKELQ